MKIKETVDFLVPHLVNAVDISDEQCWELIQRKMSSDFPWLLRGKYKVWFSGIGERWKGTRKRGQAVSHARFKLTAFFPLNAFLAWVTHFTDAVGLIGKEPFVILAPSPEAGFGAAVAKALAGNRMRLVVRVKAHTATTALYVRNSKWQFKVVKSIERFVLRRADLVVPMGRFTQSLALSDGVRPERTIVLPLPVLWASCAEITHPPASPIVLFVGRLVKEKGIPVLLKAMALVNEKIPKAQLLIVGDGSYRAILEESVSSVNAWDTVCFLGWLQDNDLRQAYRNSSLVVMPSIVEEGLGMVLIEAGLMGRPVVASNIGGIRDIIRDGENGLLVPPGDAHTLAEAIIKILKDPNRIRLMGLTNARVARAYLTGRDRALEHVRRAIYELIEDKRG